MKKPKDPKFDNFVNYCKPRLDKELKELKFSDKLHIKNDVYYYLEYHQTHGHWIFQIHFDHFTYKEKLYVIGFQYQNETIKINCARWPYNTSMPDEIEPFIGIFKSHCPGSWRVNGPITKAYVSISKKHHGIASNPDDKFLEDLFRYMIEAKALIDNELKPALRKIGC